MSRRVLFFTFSVVSVVYERCQLILFSITVCEPFPFHIDAVIYNEKRGVY
jgi:hypothetical protein